MIIHRSLSKNSALKRAVVKQMVMNKSIVRRVRNKKYVLKRIRGSSSVAGAALCGVSSASLSVTSLLGTLGLMNSGGPSIRLAGGIAAMLLARGTVGFIKDARDRFREATKMAPTRIVPLPPPSLIIVEEGLKSLKS